MSPTYHTNVFEADNVYKNPPSNVVSPIFLFRSSAPPTTLPTAGALRDPQLPATASNVCTTDARLGAPPKTKILALPVCDQHLSDSHQKLSRVHTKSILFSDKLKINQIPL